VGLARSWFSEADAVTVEAGNGVVLLDAGENFHTVSCRACTGRLDLDWWREAMGRADRALCSDLTVTCPLCSAVGSLNDLDYDWPQGFASWSLEIMNPDTAEMSPEQVAELATLIGHPIRVIYQHI
jgi:hypothetical protein